MSEIKEEVKEPKEVKEQMSEVKEEVKEAKEVKEQMSEVKEESKEPKEVKEQMSEVKEESKEAMPEAKEAKEDKLVQFENTLSMNDGLFITEDDTFDINIKWYKNNDVLFLSNFIIYI